MSQLPGRHMAMIDAAIMGDGTADARSDRQHRYALISLGAADTHFGDERHVAIIFDDDPLAEARLEPIGKVDAGQVEDTARKDRAAGRIDTTGNADTDAGCSRHIKRFDHRHDALDHLQGIGGCPIR